MITMGLSYQPSLLIADEPTTALDVTPIRQANGQNAYEQGIFDFFFLTMFITLSCINVPIMPSKRGKIVFFLISIS